ncbi:MAG: hypothetical protein RI885_1901 [Actinomycetota bacterium]|jgi:hypothetical protein
MPTQYSTVTEFLDALDPQRLTEVQSLREIVLSSHPRLVESIKWNSPNWSLDGVDRLTVNVPRSGPTRLILHRGTSTAENKVAAPEFTGDPGGLLTWHSDIRASLRMPPADNLSMSRDAMVAVLKAWLAS